MSSLILLLSLCFPCLPSEPELRINKARFKIVKLLGEGGFSYVYLVQASNGGRYALKKIRCPFGNENVKMAMREVDNYNEFRSPYIIRAIDSSIVQEPDGSKTVYILLPYFDSGSLQDVITKNVIENVKLPELELIRIFIGICRGLQSMHRHHLNANNTQQRNSISLTRDLLNSTSTDINSDTISNGENQILLASDAEDEEDDMLDATELQETIPFAHRDIKPANIMLSKDGLPVLCDLGSSAKLRLQIKTRSQAINIQELTEEHCTLPYRAPELFDIKVGTKLDEKIDIWSLGCTFYALLYGISPFEKEEQQNGANMKLAITSGSFSYPNDTTYSDEIKDIIKMCLVLDPHERPSVEQVLSRLLEIQGS